MEKEELKEKIREFVFKNKLIILLTFLILILVIVIFLPDKETLDDEVISYAKTYVKQKNVTTDLFISLYELEKAGIYTSHNCNKATGILYKNGQYEAYLMCNDYYSSNIKDLDTKNKYLSLVGSAFVVTNSTNYQDPGYILNDQKMNVQVINQFRPISGLHKIIYVISDQNGNRKSTLERLVLYTNYNSEYADDSFILYGANPYYVFKNQKYVEPGYLVKDKSGINQNSNVVVSGQVNTVKPGTYTLTYQIGHLKLTRTVIVTDMVASLEVADEDYTSGALEIKVKVTGDDYSYTKLPSGQISDQKKITYKAYNNGIYQFVIVDRYNNKMTMQHRISNIDKDEPSGSCIAVLEKGETKVTVTATDALSGVAGYYYNNGSNTTSKMNNNQYVYNNLYENVNVIIEDNAGNKKTITCTKKGDGSYAQITPASGANIIRSDTSDTLKVSIEKKSGYYLTRVWVRDPYAQVQKGVIAKWGSALEKPFNIIQREISNKNLTNKILVAINASGFYLDGSWEPNSKSYNSRYNKTTEGPLVITNGQVIRNWYYDSAIDKARNHALYAISQNGNLEVYPNFNKLSESARKSLFDKIISLNYRNTWVFRPVIMQNGQIVDSNILGTFLNSSGKRQILCQINRNNFAIISTTSKYNINGIKTILNSLSCQTAVNMDGGGSVALLYKSKTGKLETITGGSRSIADTLYFTEK
ncbi:MAG: DUF5011 domain-containing protein [Bacilli bacterium]|nr:DUF5011 domain-containing protein [Bacilli bacterium]